MMVQTKPPIPVLPGRLTPDGFEVRCAYFGPRGVWHVHGGEVGPRMAHCWSKRSPYRRGLYTMEIIEPRRRRSA